MFTAETGKCTRVFTVEKDKEIRCEMCRRLLAKGEALCLAIKCPRCGAINHVTANGSPHVDVGGKTARP